MSDAFRTISGEGRPRLIVDPYSAAVFESSLNTQYSVTTARQTSPAANLTAVRRGMRIWSMIHNPTVPRFTYAKVLEVDDVTDTITVDAWVNGTPSNGQKFFVDGWVIDLPYTKELTESFAPDVLEHSLFRGDSGAEIVTEHRGWKYEATLDYSARIAADILFQLAPALSLGLNDELYLVPRRDKPQIIYRVYFKEKIELSLFGIAGGHRKVKFVFAGKENVPSFPMATEGYGFGYAAAYGLQL